MKQVININFHGQVVPIEVSAFDLLKDYTDSLARFFADEEGKDEIINDIESRIGELFQERLKKGATCITDEHVNAIIKSMGRPEEFDGEEEKVASSLGSEKTTQSQTNTQQTATQKRLYRDENNKIIGGVCSGIARYFGTDPVIIRIIFVLLAFAGAGVLAYFILWIAVPSTASKEIGAVRKKLFRDPDDKIIAGVGSGLGNYFGVNPWIPRALFLIPFLSFAFRWHDIGVFDFPSFVSLSFSPGSLLIYIILWLVLPEASNTTEKLEMKGEKIDMNSIKNSVMEEMKGVQQRAEKFAKEASAVAGEKGQQMGSELKSVAKKGGRSLGDVIVLLVKAFAYFVIGSVVFALVVALFALAIAAIGLFPLKSFILDDGWQTALAWGTLIFFIAVPVVGVITLIIRRLAKMKRNSKVLTASFICLWVLGWVCVTCLLASVGKDFKSVNNINEEVVSLSNPSINKLELTTNERGVRDGYRYKIFRIEPFEGLDEDTAYVRNIEVKIRKSTNDSFHVTVIKMANGKNRANANDNAVKIKYDAVQKDSLLVFDKGIAINKIEKFRNQRVIVTVYVPVGKQIRIDRSLGWNNQVHVSGPWYDEGWDEEWDDEERDWQSGKDYIMKTDGLYSVDDNKPANEERRRKLEKGDDDENDDNNNNNSNDGYRYNSQPVQQPDSSQQKQNDEIKRKADSLRKEADNLESKKQTARLEKTGSNILSSYNTPLFIHL
jgi:phage shock protein PspC (stress-responsive transcriptional regulator)